MCIIALVPATVARPSSETLAECWRCNSDGAGLMYAENGKLVIDKGHMTLESFMTAWNKVPAGVAVCAHFRIATHGSKGPEMTHPFWVMHNRTAVAHNGILPAGKLATRGSGESDTSIFASQILTRMPEKWWHDHTLTHLIEEYLGYGNKVVVMDFAGDYKILNEKAGTWEGGIWYSNSGFRITRAPAATSYFGAYGGEWGGRYDYSTGSYVRPPAKQTKAEKREARRLAKIAQASLPPLKTEGYILTVADVNRYETLSLKDVMSLTDDEWMEYCKLEGKIGSVSTEELKALTDFRDQQREKAKKAEGEETQVIHFPEVIHGP